MYLKLNKDKEIENLSFEGEGCAISLASASILTEIVKGKNLSFFKKINEDFLNMIKNKKKNYNQQSFGRPNNYYYFFIRSARISNEI